MTERMRPLMFERQIKRAKAVIDDLPEGSLAEWFDWRLERNKNLAMLTVRTNLSQITQDGVPNNLLKRVSLSAQLLLGTIDDEQFAFPVEVLQSQFANLADAQAIDGEQQ